MKVGVFFFGSIYELTGAGKVVRSFAENSELFKEEGIDTISVYDLSGMGIMKSSQTDKTGESYFNIIKNFGKKLLSNTYCGSKYILESKCYKRGKALVDFFWDESRKMDVLIFHEDVTCYNYIVKCQREKVTIQKFALVHHSNGELFRMWGLYYPKIVGTSYIKKLYERSFLCMDYAKAIILVSDSSAMRFSELYPNYQSKVRVIYNGIAGDASVNVSNFDGTIKMITVGTVNSRKNQIMQIDCLPQILNINKQVELYVVGGGDMLEKCRLRAKELGVEKNVIFVGPCNEVDKWLHRANLFVMTSKDEGLPIAGIEALRAGLPVILTDVGGNKELIDKNGYLIPLDKEQLISAVKIFNESDGNQRIMAENSMSIFKEKFSEFSMLKGYCKLLIRLDQAEYEEN